jgi:glycosyltransferase involved in cell wall biosynthesis
MAKRVVIFLKAVAVARLLQEEDVELLHAHFAWLSGAAAWICSSLLEVPFTVTVHAFDVYASTDLLPLVTSRAAHVIAISEYNLQHLVSRGLRQEGSVSVVHCGVDMHNFADCLPSVDGRRDGVVRILCVGSLNAKKGHDYLIRACRVLKERGLSFSCTIIGGGVREAKIRDEIASYGVQEQVTLRGPCTQPEVIDALHEHDVFVLASVVAPNGDRDGIPVVLMEAGAAGLPVVSTHVSGIPELVRHGQTGWLVPPGDEHALADAIATLAGNPALRRRLGRNARAVVEAEFNIEASASRLEQVLRYAASL